MYKKHLSWILALSALAGIAACDGGGGNSEDGGAGNAGAGATGGSAGAGGGGSGGTSGSGGGSGCSYSKGLYFGPTSLLVRDSKLYMSATFSGIIFSLDMAKNRIDELFETPEPTFLSLNGNELTWLSTVATQGLRKSTLLVANIAGGTPSTVYAADYEIKEPAFTKTHLYWIRNRELLRVALVPNSTPEPVLAGAWAYVVTTDRDDNVYVTANDDGEKLYRYEHGTMTRTTLVQGDPTVRSTVLMAVANGYVYASFSTILARASSTAPSSGFEKLDNEHVYSHMMSDGESVYFSGAPETGGWDTDVVGKITRDGQVVILKTGLEAASGLATTEDCLYFGSELKVEGIAK